MFRIESKMTDLSAIMAKQQSAWASGNYAVVGLTLQIVGGTLCEAVDLRSGERVLDVAADNGDDSSWMWCCRRCWIGSSGMKGQG